ncbi:MAG: 4Fe-4S dicluster domain-containing protein [Candidatus Margulisiibacteriota bacterium]
MSPIDNSKEFSTTIFESPKSRRAALKSIASGMTIAALSGCIKIRKPKQKIVTYTNEPENLIPGEPNYYATSHEITNNVESLIVTSHEGRPTKIDGNPNYPLNKGKSSAHIQAELQQLYDPDRLKENTIDNKKVSSSKIKSLLNKLNRQEDTIIVLPKTTSILNQGLLSQLNNSKTHIYYIDPVNIDNETNSVKQVTGSYGYLDFDYSESKFILNFENDFLSTNFNSIKSLRDYTEFQKDIQFISFASNLKVTDSKANSIFKTSLPEQEKVIAYIAQKIISKFGNYQDKSELNKLVFEPPVTSKDKLDKIVNQLIKHRSRSIVRIGESHSVNIHKVIFMLNKLLGNINNTIKINSTAQYKSRFLSAVGFEESISDIQSKLLNEKIRRIISLDIDLTRFIPNIETLIKNTDIIYLTNYKNEFTKLANTVISKTHFLEDWGLLLSKEGHVLIQQPLINKLYNDNFSINEVLLSITNKKTTTYQFLKQTLIKIKRNLYELKRNGFVKGKTRRLNINQIKLSPTKENTSQLNLTIQPSYQMIDGRYSNNAWLNETPDPTTKLTWGNAFIISHEFSEKHNVKTGNIIQIKTDKSTISGPVLILPGQDNSTITLHYGFGKIVDGRFSGFGINADKFIPNKAYSVLDIVKTNETITLADTQMNHGMDEESLAASGIENRIDKILQIKTEDEIKHPKKKKYHIHSLFKELEYKGEYQWGMSIDLNSCLGCNACVVSCQAENNIPVVGRDQIIIGREMSWIRIDRYYIENENNEATINFMPVACVHCENAPCEQVCPVNATVHDDEGLNVMTYNRCIGTRYCANNCPYKVRRFNFFDWHQKNPQSVKKDRIHIFDYFREPAKSTQMQFNPEVTIRMRGVMEKCTYCLQRISKAKIKSKNNNDPNVIDQLETACQQSCPTNAIVFGDISNENSKISKKRKSKRRYDLLQTDLNTKPRTIYLAKVKKPIWNSKERSNGYH